MKKETKVTFQFYIRRHTCIRTLPLNRNIFHFLESTYGVRSYIHFLVDILHSAKKILVLILHSGLAL